MIVPVGGRLGAMALSAGTTAAAYAVLRRSPPGGPDRWQRSNHAGAPVTLLAGPAVVAGVATGVGAAGGLTLPRRLALASLLAGIGAVGAYDDLYGAAGVKGLRGHLRALTSGEVTSGALKTAAVSAAGVGCAAVLGARRAGLMVDGALVAGTANLVNLLDLRPGRALKTVLVTCAPAVFSSGGPLAASVVGAAAAALPDDLAGVAMLGDCAANAMGAATGCVAVSAMPPSQRSLALAAVAALTLASERISFSAVIERHHLLSRIDAWGRVDNLPPHVAP